ncbi:MAG: Y-family DNA polymerase [Planctomycetota bacterium]
MILFTTVANRQLVVCGCDQAVAAGVRPEMTLAHARALLHHRDVLIRPHEPERDTASLRALAAWARRFSPIVAVDPPDGLLLDISGCERLFHGEDRLLQRVVTETRRLGIGVRAAVASTFAAAWAMARFGETACVPSGGEREALAPLPVEALRLDGPTLEALHEVGLERIAHLLELPRASLAARFGEDLLLRLDQAFGAALETIAPIRPAPPMLVQRVFDGPCVQIEAILLTVRELITLLARQLRQRESGAVALEVVAHRVHAQPVRHALRLSHPTRDEGHLWSLLRPKVESIDMGFGVERVVLSASADGVAHEQSSRWRDDRGGGERQLGRFVDTVVGRCGTRSALSVELVASHVPERAFRLEPVRSVRPDRRRETPPDAADADQSPWPGEGSGAHRPTLLLGEPQPIEVIALAPEGPPAWITWPRGSSAVVASIGPERITGEWWRAGRRPGRFDGTRDYYAVQDRQGRWLWIYRHRDSGGWFVHGQWG